MARPKKAGGAMVPLHVRLPPKLVEQLEAVSSYLGVPIADVHRQALEQYVKTVLGDSEKVLSDFDARVRKEREGLQQALRTLNVPDGKTAET